MTAPTYKQTIDAYATMLDTMVIRPELESDIQWYVDRIIANRSRYEAISGRTGGVPWYWIGATHGRESSFSFSGHLHNGDPLTGRTYRVPAGRLPEIPPPYTFEQSAEDALEMKDLHNVENWPAERLCYEFERYNGWGYYLYRDINSPYLWSGTNHYSKGKYVADGQYDPNAVDKQMGTVAMVYKLGQQIPLDIHREGEPVGEPISPIPPRYPTPIPPQQPPFEWRPTYGTQPAPRPPPVPPPAPVAPEGTGITQEIHDEIEKRLKGSINSGDAWNWIVRALTVGAVGGSAYTFVDLLRDNDFEAFMQTISYIVRASLIYALITGGVMGYCTAQIVRIYRNDNDG